MCGLRTCFLCLVVAFCLLFGVSHSTNESVCVLSDAPQQCSAFCMAALHPLCDQYAKSKQKEEIVKMIAESRAEQKELVNRQEAMVKLIADFRAEQKKLANRSQEEMKMIADFRAEQKELLNVLVANLTASRLESTLQSRPVTVPPGFQKIGSRYFFIEEYEWKSRTDAEETCREKGGHLAALGNEDDFEAVTRIVEKDTIFWLGYHRNSKDEFVTATGNKGSFMKWDSGEPNNNGGKQNCVGLFNSLMSVWDCEYKYPFICQLDTV